MTRNKYGYPVANNKYKADTFVDLILEITAIVAALALAYTWTVAILVL